MLTFEKYNIHGAIFDMDGTMFDTERLRFQTLKQASQAMIGEAFSEEYLLQCLGLSAQSAEQLAQHRYGTDVPYLEIRTHADQLEREYIRLSGVPIKKGLIQVLERLRKSGLRMAVATSSRREIAEEYLINANVYKFFDVLVCGDEVTQGKPHPEIFLKAAEQINLAPQQCLMFEDSENGIYSASDAGGVTILLKDIKTPNAAMLAKANYYYDNMYACLTDLDQYLDVMPMPKLKEAFPQSLNQLTVGIHGFGAIGGGYLAQILSYWDGYTRPQQILASTRNGFYRNAVNAFGTYSIRYGQNSYDERIENMTVIDADQLDQMQEMYMQSSLIALCLPEKAIATEAHRIAVGLLARFSNKSNLEYEPLTVLIILNKVGAKKLVLAHIHHALLQLTDEKTAQMILVKNYFCDTVVNRMVTKLSERDLFRQLKIKYNLVQQQQIEFEEESIHDVLDIEGSSKLSHAQQHLAANYIEDLRRDFQASHILQNLDLILFHSEAEMPIYVENLSPLLTKMRQMILVDDISSIQLIKNRLWNGIHAMLAWYASLLGHETIGVAMADQRVADFVAALIAEVKQALAYQLPQRAQDLDRMAESFLSSCASAYKDPCARVARDPLRKLAYNERVFGSIEMNLQQQFGYDVLLRGASLGYAYAHYYSSCSREKIIEHLHQQIDLLSLSQSQKQAICISLTEQINIEVRRFSDIES